MDVNQGNCIGMVPTCRGVSEESGRGLTPQRGCRPLCRARVLPLPKQRNQRNALCAMGLQSMERSIFQSLSFSKRLVIPFHPHLLAALKIKCRKESPVKASGVYSAAKLSQRGMCCVGWLKRKRTFP